MASIDKDYPGKDVQAPLYTIGKAELEEVLIAMSPRVDPMYAMNCC